MPNVFFTFRTCCLIFREDKKYQVVFETIGKIELAAEAKKTHTQKKELKQKA